MPNLSRRGFLGALAGLVAAPMIVKIDSIMPVKTVQWGDKTLNDMAFTIEKIHVNAKSHYLKAEYTLEHSDYDMFSDIDYQECSRILLEEINKDIIRKINHVALDIAPVGSVFATRPFTPYSMSSLQLPKSANRTSYVRTESGEVLVPAQWLRRSS